MTKHDPLRLGLIGCGAFGRFCLEAYASLPEVKVTAVADVRKEAAEALGREAHVPAFDDPRELIEASEVDIVHVATPPASHCELVLAAARARKHVLCEKPLAMNIREADEMLSAVREAGVIAPVNFVLRYNAVTEMVKAVLDSGALGKVLAAQFVNCASDSHLPPEHWFWDKCVSGGIFIEHAVHFFDLYSYWLGPGRVIQAHAEQREDTGQEDRVLSLVRHDSGALSTQYHGFDQIAPLDRQSHRLVCELGDIRVAGWIPMSILVTAAVNEKTAATLAGIVRGANITESTEPLSEGNAPLFSRNQNRDVTHLLAFELAPEADKQAVYAESARQLLADQIAAIRDPVHSRRVTEENGREALALAEAACRLAAENPASFVEEKRRCEERVRP